jgi:fucokinase
LVVTTLGGWSDTPPICYEYGGAVTGIAVLVDNQYPLCCRSRITPGVTGMLLKTEIRDISSGDLLACNKAEIGCVDDLNDFRDPSATCALLKASLVCLGIATEEQLQAKHDLQPLLNKFCSSVSDVRLEIVTTSLLGMGTGMGTSSILGACILQTIAECVGIGKMQDVFLIHSVLMLEQLLSSGGGWQDQAHGILPGIKTIRSLPPKIPLEIQIEELQIPATAMSAFEDRLLFAYTGKTRLAKNILQQVLRRWSRRATEVVTTVGGLVDAAERMRTAILNESWNDVGEYLHESFRLKCTMAGDDSGAEPELVKLFVSKLMSGSIIQGAMLCGAGGGGFLLLLLAEDVDGQAVQSFFESEVRPLHEDFKDFSFHTCGIAPLGLTTTSITDDETMNSESFNLAWQKNHPGPA